MNKLARLITCMLVSAAAVLAQSPAGTPPSAGTSPPPGRVYEATLSNGFNMRFDHRSVMDNGMSRLYTTAAEDSYIDVPTVDIASISQQQLPPPPRAIPPAVHTIDAKSAVASASQKHALDADLIDSVIRAESGFNPRAVSPKGARGLMQLMPETAAKLGVQDSFDAQSNVDGGTRYLRELLARYHGDLASALAAYNAGPQRVEQYHGVPPYRETRAYVSSIIRDFNRKKLAARKSQPRKFTQAAPNTPAGTRVSPKAVNPVPGS